MMSTTKDDQQEMPLHCGKWTPEEEAYVQCLIEEFQAGFLPIREGTSLRSFLSKMLNCKPKRISKKFEGEYTVGEEECRAVGWLVVLRCSRSRFVSVRIRLSHTHLYYTLTRQARTTMANKCT